MLNLEEIDFHDKIVLNINLEANNDFLDKVSIIILDKNKRYVIECNNCAKVIFIGNGWISGKDSIRELYLEREQEISEDIPSFIPVEKRKEFVCLNLNFNSSNSLLKIITQKIHCFEIY